MALFQKNLKEAPVSLFRDGAAAIAWNVPGGRLKKKSPKLVGWDDNNQQKNEYNNNPKYFVIRRRSGNFQTISPFYIDRVVKEHIGVVKSIKKERGKLIIETMHTEQSEDILKLDKLGEFEITVTPHNFLNTAKGVITCMDLRNCTTDEIKKELFSQGVIHVKRIYSKRFGERQETNSIILTFNQPDLPDKIQAGIHVLPVQLYIQSPVRCFKCQRYGHTVSRCEASPVCICGKPLHVGILCERPITCLNCNGMHSAASKQCPKYKEEQIIRYQMALNKISYSEAKVLVRPKIQQIISYAEIAKKLDNQDEVTELIGKTINTVLPNIVQAISKDVKQELQDFMKHIEKISISETQTETRRKEQSNIMHSSAAKIMKFY